MAVEGRWNAPHAASPSTELVLLFGLIFDKSIWRVGDNAMNRVISLVSKPFQAVAMEDGCPAYLKGRTPHHPEGSFSRAGRHHVGLS